MSKLQALNSFQYGQRQLKKGDVFEASEKDTRILIAIKKAIVHVGQKDKAEQQKTKYKRKDLIVEK